MSILVKGLTMPDNVKDVMITFYDHDDMDIKTVDIYDLSRIAEIPTSHGPVQGRLINEFEKKLREYIDSYEIPGAMQALYEALDDAQEYIESEG